MFSTYRHNKKRNIGLLREFFSLYMAKAIVENRMSDYAKAKSLWLKYVNPKTKMYEEFQVFTTLYEYSTNAREIGLELLKRTKQICEKQSQEELDREKTMMLSEITKLPRGDKFFEQNVPGYKNLATTQVLINAWRGTGNVVGNLSEMIKLEEAVLSNMADNKKPMLEQVSFDGVADAHKVLSENKEQVDSLVFKIFLEKFNDRYGSLLSESQVTLLKGFLFSDTKQVLNGCQQVYRSINEEIGQAIRRNEFQQVVKDKLTVVREDSERVYREIVTSGNISEENLAFFMSLCPLLEELRSAENTSTESTAGRAII